MLKKLRKENKLTQSDLGEAIGIGQTSIANYENGKRFPDEKNLIRIADYFNISLDLLIGRELKNTEGNNVSGFLYEGSDLDDKAVEYMTAAQKSGSEAVNMILGLLESGYTEEQVILDLLEASLIKAGNFWAEGLYNEAMEHQLSNTVIESLIALKTNSNRSSNYRGKLAALTSYGEMHNIGIRILTRLLEIDGWETYFLGSSVPAISLLDYINNNQINMVMVSATMNENTDSLCAIIKAIKNEPNPPHVMAGGRISNLNRLQIQAAGADYIYSSIAETIDFTRRIHN